MSQDENEKSGAVDLGLSHLLGKSSENDSSAAQKSLDIDRFIDSCIEARNTSLEPTDKDENSWNRNWNQRNFSQIVTEAELLLSKNSDAVEARLWWIRSHCAAASMPVSMITAPAEIVCANHDFGVHSQERALTTLFVETLGELSNACWSSDLRHKSILFLKRATDLDNSRTELLCERVQTEIAELNISALPIAERKAAEEYRSYLKGLAADLRISEHCTLSNTSSQNTPQNKEGVSTAKNIPATGAFSFFWLPFKSALVPVAVIGALAIAGFYGYQQGNIGAPPLYPPVVESTSSDMLALQLPMPDRMELSSGPTLWHILKKLEDVNGTQVPLQAPRSISSSSTTQGGTVNTNLPVEPPELALLITAWDQREVVPGNSLLRDLDATTDTVETSDERGDTIVDGYQSIAGISRKTTEKQAATSDRMYLIVEEAAVYAHPALDAPSLALLQIGNHVEVAEILGDWYKIVSAKERIGYIQSLKAKPLSPTN